MPSEALKSMAEKHGVSLSDAERYWKEAKKSAAEGGHTEDWGYIMGIVKKRMGIRSSIVTAEDEDIKTDIGEIRINDAPAKVQSIVRTMAQTLSQNRGFKCKVYKNDNDDILVNFVRKKGGLSFDSTFMIRLGNLAESIQKTKDMYDLEMSVVNGGDVEISVMFSGAINNEDY